MNTKRFIALLCLICIGVMPANAFKIGQSSMSEKTIAFVQSAAGQNSSAQATQSNAWMLVPEWLAGTWQTQSELVLEAYDYAARRQLVQSPVLLKVERTSTIGSQKDCLGRVWHFCGTPYVRFNNRGQFDEYQTIQSLTSSSDQHGQLVINCRANVAHVNKTTGAVVERFQEITTTTYSPVDNNAILVNFEIMDYDQIGVPLLCSHKQSLETRIKPFELVDRDERGDLRQLFCRYLAGYGLNSLMPISTQSSAAKNQGELR
jgi:hypothetical protein